MNIHMKKHERLHACHAGGMRDYPYRLAPWQEACVISLTGQLNGGKCA